MADPIYDINGYPLNDTNTSPRWGIDVSNSTFLVGVTKNVARVPSLGDGDLPTSRYSTEAPTQSLAMLFYGDDTAQPTYADAWRNILNQEYVTIGRTVGSERRIAIARIESISEAKKVGEQLGFTAIFRIQGAYWRAASASTITLSAGSQDLTALDESTAPIIDAKLLVAGAATPLTLFSIEDENSGSGIEWAAPTVPIGQYLSGFGTVAPSIPAAGGGAIYSAGRTAIDSSGKLYVGDTGACTITVYDQLGNILLVFGSPGTGNGQFANPQGIYVDGSGNIFVVDPGRNRVQKFNSSGVYQSQFGSAGSGNGQFNNALAIAADSSGNLYVVDELNSRVQKFNSSGVYQSQFGTAGSGNGQFNLPVDIAIDASGNIWVVDMGNKRVQKFNSSGVYQSQFGTAGSGNGQFNHPVAIALDASGNIYVADGLNNRVQKFNSSGTYVAGWGTQGSALGQFQDPRGLAINSLGDVWVVSGTRPYPQAAVVQKFDGDGVFDGVGTGQWLLIDLASRSAQVVTSASFTAEGDVVGGLTTVPWAGDKLRLSPGPTVDPMVRQILVSIAQTGGGTAQLQATDAFL